MGLDLYQEPPPCKSCGHQEEYESIYCTYNLTPMWVVIFPGDRCLIDIEDLTSDEIIKKLEYALKQMKKHKKQLQNLEPPNGWGSYDGLISVLNKIIQQTKDNPDIKWTSWR